MLVFPINNELEKLEPPNLTSERSLRELAPVLNSVPFCFKVPVKLISPATSNFDDGLFVPIPTLPPFVIKNLGAHPHEPLDPGPIPSVLVVPLLPVIPP